MDAVEQDTVGIGRAPRISGFSAAKPKSMLRLVFGAWQRGEHLSGIAILMRR
jgi:hypothetical protein